MRARFCLRPHPHPPVGGRHSPPAATRPAGTAEASGVSRPSPFASQLSPPSDQAPGNHLHPFFFPPSSPSRLLQLSFFPRPPHRPSLFPLSSPLPLSSFFFSTLPSWLFRESIVRPIRQEKKEERRGNDTRPAFSRVFCDAKGEKVPFTAGSGRPDLVCTAPTCYASSQHLLETIDFFFNQLYSIFTAHFPSFHHPLPFFSASFRSISPRRPPDC